jgi:hypothetical protein
VGVPALQLSKDGNYGAPVRAASIMAPMSGSRMTEPCASSEVCSGEFDGEALSHKESQGGTNVGAHADVLTAQPFDRRSDASPNVSHSSCGIGEIRRDFYCA